MACCAFAAFLLVNLLAPFEVLRRRLFTARPRGDTAAAWRLATPAAASAPGERQVRWRARKHATFGAIAVLEVALAIGAGTYLLAPDTNASGTVTADAQWDALVALHSVWCGNASTQSEIGIHLAERGP